MVQENNGLQRMMQYGCLTSRTGPNSRLDMLNSALDSVH